MNSIYTCMEYILLCKFSEPDRSCRFGKKQNEAKRQQPCRGTLDRERSWPGVILPTRLMAEVSIVRTPQAVHYVSALFSQGSIAVLMVEVRLLILLTV